MVMRSNSYNKPFGFALHSIKGRWFCLYAAFLIMAGSGTMYLFGTYSSEIMVSLNYDQSQLTKLTFYKDFGANFAVINGLFAEIAPSWLLIFLGSTMNFGGYFMIWLAVTKKIAKPKFWQMCLYMFIGANAPNFSGTLAIVTSVKNFPERRGVVLGLIKSYIGLSGPIIIQLYTALYGKNDPKSLILFIAWFPALLYIIFIFTFQEKKFTRQPQEMRVFYHYLYISIAMAVFVMSITFAERHTNFSSVSYIGNAILIFVLLFILPLLISLREEHFDWTINDPCFNNNTEVPRRIQSKGNHYEHKHESESESETSFFSKIWNKPERGEDHSILQAILSMDMMYLFVTTACGLGAGLTAINNLERIGVAMGYPSETITDFASLLNTWNYAGRVYSGFVSEYLLRKHKVPRPTMLTFMLALSSIGYLLIAFPFRSSIHVACVIIGFSFGSQLPLANAIISELFGLKHFSTLFNCGQSMSPLGAYVLNAKIVQPIYGRMAESFTADRIDVSTEDFICMGEICFKDSFTVLASVAILGGFFSQILTERTRTFYEGDIYKKFKDPIDKCAKQVQTSSAR